MSHHTWLHQIAGLFIPPLARTAIRPNHITLARTVTGLGGAALIGVAQPLLGGAVYIVSMILDRMDGALARATGRCSAFGHWLDVGSDALCALALMVALGYGAEDRVAWGSWLGLAAGLGTAAAFAMAAIVDHGRKGVAGFALTRHIDVDDLLMIAPLAVMFGAGDEILLLAAALAPAFAIGFAWIFRAEIIALLSR